MSKQTLQQKIQRALARFTPRRIAIIMLGTAILSFGYFPASKIASTAFST